MTPYMWRDPGRQRRLPEHSLEARVARAIVTPETVTNRRQREGHAAWQARAVLDLITAAIREGREPFAGIRDDAVAAGREYEREHIVARLRGRAGDDLAAIVADMIGEQS